MKTLQSVRRALFLVLVLSFGWSSCSNLATDNALVAETSDVRYLVGTLASWEASQDAGQVIEDPAELMASDTPAISNLRSLESPSISVKDNVVTVTKAGNHWSGVYVTKVITRPKRPALAEITTAGGTVSQTATEKWYLGNATSGTAFATIDISMVWEASNGSVDLKSLSRRGERIGFGTANPHLLKIAVTYTAGALTSKTVEHWAGTVDTGVLLYTETFEKFAASGGAEAYTKITRSKDGTVQNYRTITPSTGTPQTIKHYINGILRESTVRTKSDTGWSLTRTRYKGDGLTVKGSISESVTITVESNTTHMVRQITTGGVTRQVTLDVSVVGDEYSIAKTIDGVKNSWTAVRGAGSNWTITPISGVAVTVDADEVI